MNCCILNVPSWTMKIKSGFSKSSVWWLPVYKTTDICQYWLKLVIKEQSHKYNCCLPELHMWWLQAAEQRDCLDRWFLLGWTACTTHQGGWHWRGNWSPPQSQDAAGQSSLHVGQKKNNSGQSFTSKRAKAVAQRVLPHCVLPNIVNAVYLTAVHCWRYCFTMLP